MRQQNDKRWGGLLKVVKADNIKQTKGHKNYLNTGENN